MKKLNNVLFGIYTKTFSKIINYILAINFKDTRILTGLTSCFLFFLLLFFTGCGAVYQEQDNDLDIFSPVSPIPTLSIYDETDYITPELPITNISKPLFDYENLPRISDGLSFTSENINYSNYLNRLAIYNINNDETIQFDYSSGFTYFNKKTGENSIHNIYDYLETDYQALLPSKELWYFEGYIAISDCIYVHYDYLGDLSISLLFCFDLIEKDILLCAAVPYNTPEFSSSFTVTNLNIFYTYLFKNNNGQLETILICADKHGSNPKQMGILAVNEKVKSLMPQTDSIFYISENEQEQSKLMKFDTKQLLSSCIYNILITTNDLMIYENYAILGNTDTKLIYYNLDTKTLCSLRIISDVDKELFCFGTPFVAGGLIYIAIYSLEEEFTTKLIAVDLRSRSIKKEIYLKNYYILGVIEDKAYLEINNSISMYDLQTDKIISLY